MMMMTIAAVCAADAVTMDTNDAALLVRVGTVGTAATR